MRDNTRGSRNRKERDVALLDKVLSGYRRGSLWAPVRLAPALGLAAAFVLVSPVHDTPNAEQDFQVALSTVREAVAPGSLVLGSQLYWFARPGQPYYSWEQLVYYRRYKPSAAVLAGATATAPASV